MKSRIHNLWLMLRYGPELYVTARKVGFTRAESIRFVLWPLETREDLRSREAELRKGVRF